MNRGEHIRKLREENKTIPEICNILNISKGTVGYYINKLNIYKPKKIKINKEDGRNNNGKKEYIIKKYNEGLLISNKEEFLEDLEKYNDKLLCNKYSLSKYSLLKIKIYLNKYNPRGNKKGCKGYNDIWDILNGDKEIICSYSKDKKNIIGSFGRIRNFIIKNNILNHEVCSVCNIKEWNNKPIKMDIDHIDGNRNNNKLENLRFICPNCHSQTDTFRNKKRNTPT